MTMRCEKAAAMPPEPRPDLLPVGLRQFQTVERGAGEELKMAFGVGRRHRLQARFYLEQKHQPMCPALITVFTDETGQMQIRRPNFDAQFLFGLAAGAGVG